MYQIRVYAGFLMEPHQVLCRMFAPCSEHCDKEEACNPGEVQNRVQTRTALWASAFSMERTRGSEQSELHALSPPSSTEPAPGYNARSCTPRAEGRGEEAG